MSNYSVTTAQVLRQTTKPSLGYRTIWTVQQDEVPLYGSSRLGLRRFSNATTGEDVRIITVDSDVTAQQISQNPIVLSDGNDNPVTPISVTSCVATRGNKYFELSNHLGNVLTVITDRKVWNTEGDIGYYSATVSSATDYYPFGMAIRGRKYNTEKYRFGFNGKENDGDWGSEMMQDYGMRVYSPAIAKFMSVDPLTASYPFYTPYQFAANSPVVAIDVDGMESNVLLNATERQCLSLEYNKTFITSNHVYRTFNEPIENKKFAQVQHKITTFGYKAPYVYRPIIHVRSDADVDYDGAHYAYTKDDKSINGIAPRDKRGNVSDANLDGEFPDGFLKSTTTFTDRNGDYIDASVVAYIALPTIMYEENNRWGIAQGDLVYMFNKITGIGIYGIVADGSGLKMGEYSDKADQVLKAGEGDIDYFIIPGTSNRNPSELTYDRIQTRGKAAFNPDDRVEDGEVRAKAIGDN